ncbi:tetratricopeptide repeat protein [Clostridium sp.]|uniref:tetratricopeptide repeat protein n=1 Tax=Clostridium sp. TaxID=1506 RepID=UPI0034642DD5
MNSDIKSYEKKIKENIGILIENNKLEEAKEIINQYENIVSNDIEIYSIKGVIAMMEGNVDEAERILREGLLLEIDNFDINYNLAYLYESDEKYIIAYRYYNKALKNADEEMIKEVSSKLEELKRYKLN